MAGSTPSDAPTPRRDVAAAPPPPRPRRRWLKWTLIAVVALVLLAVLMVALVPYFVSSRMGRSFVENTVNKSIEGRVSLGRLSLGWRQGLHVGQVVLTDPQGHIVATLDEASAPDLSLLALLTGRGTPGEVLVRGLKAAIVEDTQGQTNLERALTATPQAGRVKKATPAPAAAPAAGWDLADLALRIEDVAVRYAGPEFELVEFQVPLLTVTGKAGGGFDAAWRAILRQGTDEGQLTGDVRVSGLLDEAGVWQTRQAEINAVAQITALPLAAADRLLRQDGKLTALLGPTLDAAVTVAGTAANLAIDLDVKAQHLTAAGAGRVDEQTITVNPGAGAVLTLTPAAWDKLVVAQRPDAPMLADPVQVQLTVDRLDLPRPRSAADAPAQGGDAMVRLSIGDAVFESGDARIGRLAVRGFHAQANFDADQRTATAQARATAEQGPHHGQLAADATVIFAVDAQGAIDWQHFTVQNDVRLDGWPLALVDQLAGTGGLAEEAIGPLMDVHLKAAIEQMPDAAGEKPQRTGTFHLAVQAARLRDVQLTGRMDAQTITIEPGSVGAIELRPQLLNVLAAQWPGMAQPVAWLALQQPTVMNVEMTTLTIPASGSMNDAQVGALVRVDRMMLGTNSAVGEAGIGPVVVTVPTTRLGAGVTARIDSHLQVGGQAGFLKLQLTDPSPFEPSRQLSAGGEANLTLTPAVVDALKRSGLLTLPQGRGNVTLAGPTTVRAELSQLDWPIGQPDARAAVAARLTLDRLALTGDAQLSQIVIEPLSAHVESSALGRTMSAAVDGGFKAAAGEGTIALNLKARELDTTQPHVEMNLAARRFPTALLELATDQAAQWTALLGPTLDEVDLTLQPQGEAIHLAAKVNSPTLVADVRGRHVTGQRVTLDRGSTATLRLQPDRFAAWQQARQTAAGGEPGFTLASPAELRLTVEQLRAALPGEGQAMNLRQVALDASLAADRLDLRPRGSDQPLVIDSVQVRAATTDLHELLTIEAQGSVLASDEGGAAQSRPLRSTTRLSGLVDAAGVLSVKDARIQTDTQAENLPTVLVLGLTGMDADYAGIIGQSMSLTARGQVPGALDFSLVSPNIAAPLKLSIDEQRVLGLREDALLTMKLTPELADALLKFGSPVLVDAQAADQPVRLAIRADTFHVPLIEYDPTKLSLDARLELGEMTMRRGWAMNELEVILRAIATAFDPRSRFGLLGQEDRTMTVAFTPLDVSVHQGQVTTNDLWMYNPTTAMGFKGAVNLATRRINSKMGLYGEAILRTIPNLRREGIIDANMIYEFAVRGTLDAPKVDSDAFVRSLAARAGQQQLGRLLGDEGGLAAGVLGAILGGVPGSPAVNGQAPAAWPNLPQLPPLDERQTTETAPAESAAPQQQQERPQRETRPEDVGLRILGDILQRAGEQQNRDDKK